jgi:hypothetical protein
MTPPSPANTYLKFQLWPTWGRAPSFAQLSVPSLRPSCRYQYRNAPSCVGFVGQSCCRRHADQSLCLCRPARRRAAASCRTETTQTDGLHNAYLCRGDNEQALYWLEQAYREHLTFCSSSRPIHFLTRSVTIPDSESWFAGSGLANCIFAHTNFDRKAAQVTCVDQP